MAVPGSLPRDSAALIAFVDSRQTVPYSPGRDANDCVGYALAAVEAQTGRRVARALRWTTAAGGLRMLKRWGGIEAAFDAHFERIAPAFALPGDIAGVSDAALGIHPMIVEGDTLVCPGDGGNCRAKRKMMVVAWSAVRQKAAK